LFGIPCDQIFWHNQKQDVESPQDLESGPVGQAAELQRKHTMSQREHENAVELQSEYPIFQRDQENKESIDRYFNKGLMG
jgi:hypothetical protein